MQSMVKEGHIDPDLFRLFVTAKVYRSYADRFLNPNQVVEIDIGQYLT